MKTNSDSPFIRIQEHSKTYYFNVNFINYIKETDDGTELSYFSNIIYKCSDSYADIKDLIRSKQKVLNNKKFIDIPVYYSSYDVRNNNVCHIYIDRNLIYKCICDKENKFSPYTLENKSKQFFRYTLDTTLIITGDLDNTYQVILSFYQEEDVMDKIFNIH